MLHKSLMLVCLLLSLVGCTGNVGAPITSQPDTPELTTEFVMEKDLEFRSIKNGFVLEYPADWEVAGENMIWVEPSEADFPQDHRSILTEVDFSLFTRGPYVGNFSRKWRIPQSAREVAQVIVGTRDYPEVIQPVKAVSINGFDGATSLMAVETRIPLHRYGIVLRIASDKVIVLGTDGPASRSEEMQNILNAIALNIRPIEE
ncbi:MAG: hypothetical protein KBE23_12445 [Chloroflexi bacterium]|nr:hypothetical protein [Chloroflexota bacterium]MBP7043547.1 hypothetical protein [Chloroflexota bacterium]